MQGVRNSAAPGWADTRRVTITRQPDNWGFVLKDKPSKECLPGNAAPLQPLQAKARCIPNSSEDDLRKKREPRKRRETRTAATHLRQAAMTRLIVPKAAQLQGWGCSWGTYA